MPLASQPSRLPRLLVLISIAGVSSGCVALSIPSQRFHDPADRGGIFGDFRGGGQRQGTSGAGHGRHAASEFCGDADCTACGSSLYATEEELHDDERHHEKPPEVPWPRYHPVPTRPVFSGFPGLP